MSTVLVPGGVLCECSFSSDLGHVRLELRLAPQTIALFKRLILSENEAAELEKELNKTVEYLIHCPPHIKAHGNYSLDSVRISDDNSTPFRVVSVSWKAN